MDEINYIPTDTYFGNSNNENVTMTSNEFKINSEENLSDCQSENEVDIKNLLISKYDKRNEILKQKPKLDINTMESIRISHSFKKSKNSQSLTQIINQPFIHMQKNSKKNDDNCSNQTIKFKNNSITMEIGNSSMSNKCFYYKDSNEEKNSLISIEDKKDEDLDKNHVSVLNQDFFKDNKNNQDKLYKDNNYDFNNNCLKKCKIGNIFKEIFEERIKSNKLSENDSSKKNDTFNKNEIKKKLLGYKNKENYYLSLFDSDKYSSSNTKKSSNNQVKEKELTIEINNSNKEKYGKDNLIDLNNLENKTLIISNIDNIDGNSIENQEEKKLDNLKSKNKKIKEKKNGIILYAFDNKNENEDNYDKNVMISELDIKISKTLSDKEKNNNNSPIKKTEVSKKLNNGNDNEYTKEKCVNTNKKNLNTDCNKNKRKHNNIINYIYRKTFKLDKLPTKKICSYKNIKNANKNIKSVKSVRGKKVLNFQNDTLKKYKNNNSYSNHNTKTIIKKQNILNNSRSNCSFLALNISNLNRININNKTLPAEIYRNSYSRYLNTGSSLPKNKKIKVYYVNYLSKNNNIFSKNTHSNLNKYSYKNGNEININQNNDTKEKIFSNTIENKGKIINYNKLSKINKSFLTKMNKAKDFTIFTINNNSHFNKIMNNSHKKNHCKNDKNNSKQKENHFCNINKDMILFKRKINRIKKTYLYSNNTKILKRKNLNTLKEKIYSNKFEQNSQNEPASFKNENKIANINNSCTQNIILHSIDKPTNIINNNCSNSLLLTNISNNKNLMNQNKNIKSKENILAKIKPINKFNTYIINHFVNFRESKSTKNKNRKIISDIKIKNKTSITHIEKNKKKIKKNASELKYKMNNILITINNNSNNNILQKKISFFHEEGK